MLPPEISGPFLRVTAANFFFFLNFASFFLLPIHIKALGGNEVEVGLIMGTTGFASLLFMTFVAQHIDRIGPKRFLLAGATGMTIAACLFPTVDRVGVWLFALRVFQGVSFACAFTATTSMAARLAAPERRARALGLFGLSTILTHAIAPGVGEEIVHRAGFHTLFGVAACCTVVSLLLATRIPAVAGAASHGHTSTVEPLSRSHWIVAASTILAGMGFGTVMTFVAVYTQSEAFGRAAVFFTAYTSTAILTRFVGAGLSDRFGRRAVVMPALTVLGCSIGLIALARDSTWLAIAGLFFGAAQGISYPTMHALIVDLSRESQFGRVQALFNGAFNLGVTIGSFVFGPVAHVLGYRPMFGMLATTPVLAAGVLALFNPGTKPR